jgi:predicted SAM-dependent methyltransferase
MEAKLFARVWLNVLLPHRLLRYRRLLSLSHQKLHMGCGSQIFDGWINADMNPKGDFTLDLREGLPFRDESLWLVYSEHTLEHFYREHDAPFLLKECFRCLEPGGRIRITIPDGEAFIRFYCDQIDDETKTDLRQGHSRFFGTDMDIVNSGFRWKHQHFYMYDEETFRKLLEEIGYVQIQRYNFRESAVPELEQLDSPRRRIATLYMEGSKPAAAT